MNPTVHETAPLDVALHQALTLFNARRYPEMENLARLLVEAHPDSGSAWKMLGASLQLQGKAALTALQKSTELLPDDAVAHNNLCVALCDLGRPDEALASCNQALQLKPDFAEAHYNLGNILLDLAQTNDAVASYRRALQIKPRYADAHCNLGNALRDLGQLDASMKSCLQALEIQPDHPEAHNNLGLALTDLGRPTDAVVSYLRALHINLDQAKVHNNLGVALQSLGQPDSAVASYRRALQIKPDYAEAHCNLGTALQDLGKLDDAIANYHRALEIKPRLAEAHGNLGNALRSLGRIEDAIASYRQALKFNPDYAETHSNLGNVFNDLGQFDDAVASYSRALQIKSNIAETHSNLGNALQSLGHLDEALASHVRAIGIKPDYPEAHNNLGNALKDLGQLDSAAASYCRALQLRPDFAAAHSNLLFTLNYHPDKSGEEIFADYIEYDKQFGLPHRGTWRAHGNNRDTRRRLKVGYVSPDFCRHSIRHFLEPLLAHHDKAAVEIYAYAELLRGDEVTARYQGYADHWVPTVGMSDAALAERIRADGIDILVDLAGHTANNRLQAFARKPAPVSLSWLGFGYSTGLTAVDYLLTAEASIPTGSEALFSEMPWRLETPSCAYRPAEGMGQVSPLPAAARGYITFATLTRAVRINHRTISVWSALLKRVDGARLVIDSQNFQSAATQDALTEKFAEHGIRRERLEIGFHSPPWDVLRGIDIGLDCFPHNSGTTLFEMLYMGVPFVTLAGRPSVGRLGSSILHGLGHPEWIAGTEDEYVEIAAALAADLPPLASLRAGLRGAMQTSPLMDEAGFARKVEAAYLEMFGKWVRSTHVIESRANQSLPQNECDRLLMLFNAGQHEQLEILANQLLVQSPDAGFAWKMLGASLIVQDKAALPALQRAEELLPDDAEVHSNLSIALQILGKLDLAVASCYRALQIEPDFAEAHYNLGNVLKDLEKFEDAAASYRKALQIKPDYSQAQYNLGNALKALGQLDHAAASYRKVLQNKPDYAKAHSNLGNILAELGQHDHAVASFRRALQHSPNLSVAHNNLLFTLNYHPDKLGEEIFAEYLEYDKQFGLPHRGTWCAHGNSRDTRRRLKVGYVSPDFCRHSTRHFLEPLLAHHDKAAVEIYAYAELHRGDEVTARYQGYADHWVPTVGMSDAALAERIRADGIDILVDLAGHNARNRLLAFARKPAPVSLSWLGFGYTTGLSAMDYLLADEASIPTGSEALFSETPWRLETPSYVYRGVQGMGEINPLPAAASGYVTFGTLTRAVRINHRTIRVWSALLKRVDGARLVIDSLNFKSTTMQGALAEKFATHGIGRERLEIGYHSPPWEILRNIDIGLDCFPHNSGTTLFESLYMGVPFVTLAGRPSVGRIGSSILQGLGHPEWIAGTEDEYVEVAATLAADLPRLASLRAGLRAEMETGPLMDEAGFARKVEAAYRAMFRNWTAGMDAKTTS